MARRSYREHGPGRYYGPESDADRLEDWRTNYTRRPTSTCWEEIAPGIWERRCACAVIQARRGRNGRWWGYTPYFCYGGRLGYALEHTAKATATREAGVTRPPSDRRPMGPCDAIPWSW